MTDDERRVLRRFNRSLERTFRDALGLSLKEPGLAFFVLRTIYHQKRAARLRLAWERRGTHVPGFMILSVTDRCNLRCRGCYARAQHRCADEEMGPAKLRGVVREAKDLGVSVILLAGGEPLLREDILGLTGDFPGLVFPLLTNGLLIDAAIIERFRQRRNVVPVVSLEGREGETDERRGEGVYERAVGVMRALKGRGIFFGTSITVTRRNFETVTAPAFAKELIAAGCRLFFFVDYVPVEAGTEDLVLTGAQRAAEAPCVDRLRAELPGLFIAFPGDEEWSGGCLAAGRGFVHVSAAGRVEPCPFSPFSDANLKDVSLREALGSELLRAIRENHADLIGTRGGCALWEKRDWVRSLLGRADSTGRP